MQDIGNSQPTKTIDDVLDIVKQTLKKINQIDRQVRLLSKVFPTDLKTSSGNEKCNTNGWSQIHTATSQLYVTISFCNKSNQCCQTGTEDDSVNSMCYPIGKNPYDINALDIEEMPNQFK